MFPTEQFLDSSANWLLGYIGYWQGKNDEHPRGNALEFYNGFNESVIVAFTSYALPVEEEFAKCFMERGEAMLQLIAKAMGKPIASGRAVFQRALEDAGHMYEYDDSDVEYDEVGDMAYSNDADLAAD